MPSTSQSILVTVTLFMLAGCSSRETATVTKEAAASAWTDASPHTTGVVTANGIHLNYLDWGGTGPNLILIHGLGDNPHVFDEIVPSFGGQFRIVAYARRGHGRSSKTGPFDTGTLTEDLKTLMDSQDRQGASGRVVDGRERDHGDGRAVPRSG